MCAPAFPRVRRARGRPGTSAPLLPWIVSVCVPCAARRRRSVPQRLSRGDREPPTCCTRFGERGSLFVAVRFHDNWTSCMNPDRCTALRQVEGSALLQRQGASRQKYLGHDQTAGRGVRHRTRVQTTHPSAGARTKMQRLWGDGSYSKMVFGETMFEHIRRFGRASIARFQRVFVLLHASPLSIDKALMVQ